uniref:carbamoyl-phosphate synthase large subunit n=1 Tax=Amycolatopsis anabasis TaxID=1840409 RepID=UPI00131E36C9
NDITGETPASFEPSLDYVVVKVPKFVFEKFPGADPTLTTTMKSVGEVMAIGRSFPEALQKALRSLEDAESPFSWSTHVSTSDKADLLARAAVPGERRLNTVLAAIRAGAGLTELAEATGIDPWFLDQIVALDELAREVAAADSLSPDLLRAAKRYGFSDAQLAGIRGLSEDEVRAARHARGIRPVYKTVDTCAAEFAANTPYHYSSYDEETEVAPRNRPAVLILGAGPNRIGQGIEFDYSCVHACTALSAAGFDTVMVNCNPETVSTDYDTSDRLYFEPLTTEDVLEVVHAEAQAGPVAGVLVQLGGQTPLGLAQRLADAGVPIAGTPPEAIHLAEERGGFGALLADAGLPAPRHGTASSFEGAKRIADEIGYPVLVRPSYVLGGRGMEIAHDEAALRDYIALATRISAEHPVLVDEFLAGAVEIDVDALYDGEELFLGGVLEHIEEAGVHSGDSACTLPPISLSRTEIARLRASTEALASRIGVRGLINIQFALARGVPFVLEVNPRASRTVPFVAKATAVPLAAAAARIAVGARIAELRAEGVLPPLGDAGTPSFVAVKEAVLPWNRFRDEHGLGVDTLLGPEMRSTGEVMGIDIDFGGAFAKAQTAAGLGLPGKGRVLVSVGDPLVRGALAPLKALADLGFELLAAPGFAELLRRNGVQAGTFAENPGAQAQLVHDRDVDLVVSIPAGPVGQLAGREVRAAAAARGVPCLTTVPGLIAAVQAVQAAADRDFTVRPLQELHASGITPDQGGATP